VCDRVRRSFVRTQAIRLSAADVLEIPSEDLMAIPESAEILQ
jgi:hypothetical protein